MEKAMKQTEQELLQFVQEHDVKFVRLVFCDLFGRQKNITIMAQELPKAFAYGISFDGSAVLGYATVECSDLFLVPDCSTVVILPWEEEAGRMVQMFCDIKRPDGSDLEEAPRTILRKAVQRAAKLRYICRIGTECEFYLLKTEEGAPLLKPMDQGSYADTTPLDQGDLIRREICTALEALGMKPESAHHERGKGQNEIDFRYSDALTAADSFMTFKWVVKSVAHRHQLFASFLPKPFWEDSGNGLHINLSLAQGAQNLFQTGDQHNPYAESFIQGILDHAAEITAFLNPINNSYCRLGCFEAPRYVTWSHQNRSQLVRIPASSGEYSRMELRSADPACNPYLAFALLIHAGMEGVEQGKKLEPPCNRNLYEVKEEEGLPLLPRNLREAIDIARESEFIKKVLPESLRQKYFAQQERWWREYGNENLKEEIAANLLIY
jgi:glutamine synthetase